MSPAAPVSPFNGSSEDDSYSTQTESEQECDTGYELTDHTWQFPSLEVARMLSPKKPKLGVEVVGGLLLLDQYDCVVDEPPFQKTLDDVMTQFKDDNNPTSQLLDRHNLAALLTRYVAACYYALERQRCALLPQDRWYKDLDLTLTDGCATAGEPIPFNLGEKFRTGAHGSWKEAVSQASGIVRHLFGADQVRSFVLVWVFNWDSKVLRLLIFHHGGVTASEPCHITESGGLKEAVRMFLALAFWSTTVGTGFLPSCTNTEYTLAADCLGKIYRLTMVDDVLLRSPHALGSQVHLLRNPPTDDRPSTILSGAPHHRLNYIQPMEIYRSENNPILSGTVRTVVMKTSWREIGRRGNEVAMYRASNGRFGTIPPMCSSEGVGEYCKAISNILFLPRKEDIARLHWLVFCKSPPTNTDLRTLWVTVFGIKGQSLVQAKSPRQLSCAWVHSILGWLSTHLSGYLHLGPSIRNILMTAKPMKRKEFEVPRDFLDSLPSMVEQELVGEIQVLCDRVKELVKDLGISDECIGFITDGDLAIPWNECFSGEPRGTKLGTLEFMSWAVVREAEMGLRYLHSPVDDLESFFWVALWSVLFSEDGEGSLSPQELQIRNALTRVEKDKAAGSLSSVRNDASNIMKCFFLVLSGWWSKVMQRAWEWGEVVRRAPIDAAEEYYLPRFHHSALQGVVDVLEVISGEWDGKAGWDSWTKPTQSSLELTSKDPPPSPKVRSSSPHLDHWHTRKRQRLT